MLTGTTYAWYTDSVTSGKNTLIAGNLDVELFHSSKIANPEPVDQNTTNLFKMNRWEPGCIVYENFTVKNSGSLEFDYRMSLNVFYKNSVIVDNRLYDLTDVIKIIVLDKPIADGSTRDAVRSKLQNAVTLREFMDSNTMTKVLNDGKVAADGTDDFCVILYWEPGADDDIYNINNGKLVDDYDANDPSRPNRLRIDLGVNLVASQTAVSEDAAPAPVEADTTSKNQN